MKNRDYYKGLEGAIAVIGMSGAFPKAKNIDEYWQNIINGRECFDDLSEEDLDSAGIPKDLYGNPNYVRRSASLDSAKEFDPAFFGYTPAEARIMDPQHRLFLEHCWKCLEDGNIIPKEFGGLIGVFGGCSQNNYLLKNLIQSAQADKAGAFQLMLGNDKDYLTTKVSYKMDLKGPSITLQTACSTSLTAIQQGCLSLLNYQSDMVLCGGVSVNVPHKGGYLYKDGLIFSPDGVCRTFDSKANGTVFGDGVGVVLLRRLEDALESDDQIYAIVRGSSINNDGSDKVGYTAPSVNIQAEAAATALAVSEVSADTIGYIESHGTGTLMGDPIEIAALTEAFRMETERTQFCRIGSVKPNIGHLDAAAGVAGFIKAVLILNNKIFPPQINYSTPNPALNLEESPFMINKELRNWDETDIPRRAGVNSLGVGGTNVHVILEEYNVSNEDDTTANPLPQLLVFSAKSEKALHGNIENSIDFITQNAPPLDSFAYTLQMKRNAFGYRDFHVLTGIDDPGIKNLKTKSVKSNLSKKREAAFLFTGQGSQYPSMGKDLYESIPLIRDIFDECFSILMSRKDLDLKKIFFPESIDLDESSRLLQQTFYTQPALFILEYAMARYWLELGLNPRYLLGHSLGEYTAACISGVFTLEDALCLVTDRGRLMQSAPEGSMLSIPLSQNEIEAFLDSDKLQISVKNSPNRCVVSGTNEAIERLRIRLEGDGIRSSILKTSHAYHSFMMDSILDDFSQCFSGVSFSPPKIPVISNLTGDILSEAEITSKEYWINQLRLPVDFEAGVSRLLSHDNITLLEIGPGNTLCTLARSHDDISRENLCVPSVRNPKQRQDDYTFLLTAIGRLWQYGHSINWAALFKDVKKPRFIRIPTYSFSHEEYWIEEYSTVSWNNSLPNEESYTGENELSLEDRVLNVWNEVFGMENISLDDNFYDLGGHSVLATQLLLLLNETFNSAISLGSLLMEPTPANSLQVISKDISIKYKNNESLPQKHNLPILFPVQKGNKDCTNLFMVAGLYANRYYYSETEGQKEYEEDYFRYFSTLVKDIGPDQPIYGFRPKGLFLNEKFHKNVKEMAREYVDALKIIQPEGPYFIGGECVGGIVAYEIAHRLILEGDEVSHLLLMDTMHPKTHSLRMHFLKKVKRTIIDYIKGPFRLHRSIKGFCKSLASLQEILLPITKKQYALRRVKFGNLIYLYKLLRYAPKEMDTDITILANKHWLKTKDSTLGWAKNSKIECKLVEIPGDHVTRLTTHGKVTGGHIRKIIDNLSLNRMDAS